ncbi:MAG: VanW family protein [Actinomycetota bacterium]|nr:VanW family protein [Actinomycetota bacterium]
MAKRRTRVLLAAGIPVLIVVVLVAAWAIDTGGANGKVPRNVRLAGRDIGQMPEDKLAATVRSISRQYESTEVEVATPQRSYKVSAGKLGLALDEDATVSAALDIGRHDSAPLRPIAWLSSFLQQRKVALRFQIRRDVLAAGLASLEGQGGSQPKEPVIVATNHSVGIIGGSSGTSVDPRTVADELLRRASSGELPIVVQARAVVRQPQVSDARARQVARDLAAKTAKPLQVKAGTQVASFTPATVRSWLGSTVGPNGLQPTLDTKKVMADVRAEITQVGRARNAAFRVDGPKVTVVPSQNGTRCCAADTSARLLRAIRSGSGVATVNLVVDKPTLTTAAARKLGIKEPVGTTTVWKDIPQVKSFTTYHPGGAPRVTNIHLMADAVRGAIIKPGQTFSLDGRVGQRTAAKGYVVAPEIANGVDVQGVGGGVSQFSTTLFNAAFFAGLDIVEYQAHSLYLSRYPYGREATLGWPLPDQKIKNNTPYGILIWTSYTPTSVTVTMYSTPYAYGEQTAQTKRSVGACTGVTTQRTRHFPGGKTKVDTFRAVYRPAQGVKCG